MFLGVDLMNINDIKNSLISEIEKLVEIIKKEYPNLVDIPINYDLKEMVHIEETGTISLFVSGKNFYFPLDAFKVLGTLKKIPGFGMMKNHKTCNPDNMIINDNTYITYIKHVFLKGLTPEEYFKEILLHETLHFCGSGGGTAIREGINELKTRQLAKKYGLLTSSCGYPKETKIAYELEKIFGEDIINKISFSRSYREIKEILDSVSPEASSFFFSLETIMEKEFHNKYMKFNFPGLTGPFKKTQKYNSIDYTKAYALIDEYKRSLQMPKPVDVKGTKGDNSLSKTIENNKQKVSEAKEPTVEEQLIQPQTNYGNNSGSINMSSTYSQLNNTVSNTKKKTFDQRSQTEIKIAEQIRFKNQAIAQQKKQQKLSEKPKTLVKTNPNSSTSNKGYVDVVILSLVISFVAGMLTIIMYSIFK